MQIRSLDKLIKQLSIHEQEEVCNFVLFLLQKHEKKRHIKPQFKWAGALKNLADQYTSVQLQHQISSWRTGSIRNTIRSDQC